MNALALGDRRGWYGGLTREGRRYLKTTALHAATGGELYRVDQVAGGEVVHTATVRRVQVPGDHSLRYSIMFCRSIPGQTSRELHGPWFDYAGTRAEADARAAQAVAF